jgi:hypothetical protein
MEKDLIRFNMMTRLIPRLGDFILKTRHSLLKIPELQGSLAPRATIIGEEKWTMIQERRRKGMGHMRVKA